jgi:3-deoxy-D-manno-octulosonic acid kinase
MQALIHKQKSLAIVYDADLVEAPGVELFSVDYWKMRQALAGEAIGRGSAWFIDAPFGPVVLRQYLRGGWVAKISRQSYFFTGIERSRPFREFRLLAALHDLGLPVPQPVAALCKHHGILSSGAIMTVRISAARTLADVLPENNGAPVPPEELWEGIGSCIRRFHDAGAWHADLNARNILLDEKQQVFLIDFDRARFTPGTAVSGQGNLERLKRSLAKLWPGGDLSTMQPAWDRIMAGYRG